MWTSSKKHPRLVVSGKKRLPEPVPRTTRELLPSPIKPSVRSVRSPPPLPLPLLPLVLLFYRAPLLYLALHPPMLELVSLFLVTVQAPGLELEPKLMVLAESGVQ